MGRRVKWSGVEWSVRLRSERYGLVVVVVGDVARWGYRLGACNFLCLGGGGGGGVLQCVCVCCLEMGEDEVLSEVLWMSRLRCFSFFLSFFWVGMEEDLNALLCFGDVYWAFSRWLGAYVGWLVISEESSLLWGWSREVRVGRREG